MILAKIFLAIFRPFFYILKPYKTIGKHNIPKKNGEEPVMFVSNHISNNDPIHLLICQRRHIFFMAKEELFVGRIKIWFFAKVIGAFPVSRGKGDMSAIDTSKEVLKRGDVFGIFPEGTRSKDGKMSRPKSGMALIAAQSGATIVPIALVTKNQKPKFFQKTKIVFGTPLTVKDLKLDDAEHPDLKFALREWSRIVQQMIDEHSK